MLAETAEGADLVLEVTLSGNINTTETRRRTGILGPVHETQAQTTQALHTVLHIPGSNYALNITDQGHTRRFMACPDKLRLTTPSLASSPSTGHIPSELPKNVSAR